MPTLNPGDNVARWTLLRYEPGNSPRTNKGAARKRSRWWCHCTCGTEQWVPADNLTRGLTQGCRKCAKAGRKKHEAVEGLVYEGGVSLQSALLAWGR